MYPDTELTFKTDVKPTNPFDGALVDQEVKVAADIIMTGMISEFRLDDTFHLWIRLREKIEGLGFDHGRAVLEEISTFVDIQGSVSVLQAEYILIAYRDRIAVL